MTRKKKGSLTFVYWLFGSFVLYLCLNFEPHEQTMETREDVDHVNILTLEDLEGKRNSLSLMEIENRSKKIEQIQTPNVLDFSGKALEKKQSISIESLSQYKDLVNAFYTIDAAADIGANKLNAKKMSEMDVGIEKNETSPQILIYHTHSQEGFADSIPGDDSTTIMGVGEHLSEILREEYGYQVLHHLGKYDVKSRDSAYANSLPEIEELLEQNPSIEVVIDLHRDAVADLNKKYVMEWQGKQTARFMYFNGVSQSRKNGEIDYLYNENLEMNLAFSFQMKKLAEEYYPGLTRKNYIQAYRYNMHLMPRYTLVELGAQNNTLEEAMNACIPIAHILDMVLSGEDG